MASHAEGSAASPRRRDPPGLPPVPRWALRWVRFGDDSHRGCARRAEPLTCKRTRRDPHSVRSGFEDRLGSGLQVHHVDRDNPAGLDATRLGLGGGATPVGIVRVQFDESLDDRGDGHRVLRCQSVELISSRGVDVDAGQYDSRARHLERRRLGRHQHFPHDYFSHRRDLGFEPLLISLERHGMRPHTNARASDLRGARFGPGAVLAVDE
jgi:hypothetical protein